MHDDLPNQYYFIKTLDTNLINKQYKNIGLIYRNYSNKNLDIKLIQLFKSRCKQKRIKFFISNNIKLANNLRLDGAYIPSFNKEISHLHYTFQKNFIIIGSAHNIKEIRIKEIQKVKAIFISSIYKNNKNYLGINKFKNLKKLTKKTIVALGGISKKNQKKLKLVNCKKFSGISYFEEKKGP